MELVIQQIADMAIRAIAVVWRAQGHELTGQAVRDMETRIIQTANGYRIDGYLNDYMAELNEGTPRVRIPRRGTAGYKKTIVELTDYARKRGMDTSKRSYEQIAYAIISTWQKEDKPTRASARFSSTGRRTGFVDEALSGKEAEFEDLIFRGVETAFNVYFDNFIKTILGR